ncbi:MAG TPA: DUF5335 family protein [Thermoanaerobaculia bacterium]|nr:DUF5335 family protein [Thermoanaerobaculia bacterium]
MKTSLIDEHKWKAFAEAFTRSHNGWLATLELREGDAPARVAVDELPFRGATIEKRGLRETLVLMFGDDAEEHFAHIIEQPRALKTIEAEDFSEASLVIDLGDGSSCILELSNPLIGDDFAEV